MNRSLARLACALASTLLFAPGCGDDDGGGDSVVVDAGVDGTPAADAGPDVPRVVGIAVTVQNQLVTFDLAAPGKLLSSVPVTGLQPGENIAAMDIRPTTGQLYAVGSMNYLYTLEPDGTALSFGTMFVGGPPSTSTGMDVNPAVDRIRVVTDGGANFRVNPVTGLLTSPDNPLAYAASDPNTGKVPAVTALAYSPNVAGPTETTAYAIDVTQNTLVTVGGPNGLPSPNVGGLFTVGPLGFDASATVLGGFDIGTDGKAYAILGPNEASGAQLYTIDLTTGTATLVGTAAPVLARAFAIGFWPPLE